MALWISGRTQKLMNKMITKVMLHAVLWAAIVTPFAVSVASHS